MRALTPAHSWFCMQLSTQSKHASSGRSVCGAGFQEGLGGGMFLKLSFSALFIREWSNTFPVSVCFVNYSIWVTFSDSRQSLEKGPTYSQMQFWGFSMHCMLMLRATENIPRGMWLEPKAWVHALAPVRHSPRWWHESDSCLEEWLRWALLNEVNLNLDFHSASISEVTLLESLTFVAQYLPAQNGVYNNAYFKQQKICKVFSKKA